MENSIRKYIEEYEGKIEDEEIRLLNIVDNIQKRRAAKEDYTDLRRDRAVVSARQQAYIQAKADFKSILGEL